MHSARANKTVPQLGAEKERGAEKGRLVYKRKRVTGKAWAHHLTPPPFASHAIYNKLPLTERKKKPKGPRHAAPARFQGGNMSLITPTPMDVPSHHTATATPKGLHHAEDGSEPNGKYGQHSSGKVDTICNRARADIGCAVLLYFY